MVANTWKIPDGRHCEQFAKDVGKFLVSATTVLSSITPRSGQDVLLQFEALQEEFKALEEVGSALGRPLKRLKRNASGPDTADDEYTDNDDAAAENSQNPW